MSYSTLPPNADLNANTNALEDAKYFSVESSTNYSVTAYISAKLTT